MDVRVGLWRKLRLNNWCFWTVVLEKTLESSLDCKEIQPVHSEGDQPWDFFGRNDAKAETSVLWPLHAKSWLIGKDSDDRRDWGTEEKGTTEDEMAAWHHWLDGREFEWTPGVGNGQGDLVYCDSWGCKESDLTERLKWTELNWKKQDKCLPNQTKEEEIGNLPFKEFQIMLVKMIQILKTIWSFRYYTWDKDWGDARKV